MSSEKKQPEWYYVVQDYPDLDAPRVRALKVAKVTETRIYFAYRIPNDQLDISGGKDAWVKLGARGLYTTPADAIVAYTSKMRKDADMYTRLARHCRTTIVRMDSVARRETMDEVHTREGRILKKRVERGKKDDKEENLDHLV